MQKASNWASIQEIAAVEQLPGAALQAFFADFQVAPVFEVDGVPCLLADDAHEVAEMITAFRHIIDTAWSGGGQIRHPSGVEIWIGPNVRECKSFGVALRNLWRRLSQGQVYGDLSVEYLAGSLVRCVNDDVASVCSSTSGEKQLAII